MIFVVQMLLAHLPAPGDFAASGVGVPMGNYVLIPLAVFAFYPWGGFRDVGRRRLIEAGLITAIVLHPLLILGLPSMHRRGARTDQAPADAVGILGTLAVPFSEQVAEAWRSRPAMSRAWLSSIWRSTPYSTGRSSPIP